MGDLIELKGLVDPVTEWQGFYTAQQVSRLAKVPRKTLTEWNRLGIIRPSLELRDEERLVAEGYSYAELTLVRMLRAFQEGRLDLKSAGIALRHLYERLGPPSKGWANAKIYIVGSRVYADRVDEWGVTAATQYGQVVETRVFGDMFSALRRREPGASLIVPTDYWGAVDINPRIMSGVPVVVGTRIPTSVIAQLAARGKTPRQIAQYYPGVSSKLIQRVLEYERYLDQKATLKRKVA